MNLAEQIWGDPKDWRPTYRVTHFPCMLQVFLRWHWYRQTYPNHTSSKLWTSPRPGQCNWECSAAILAPLQLTTCAGRTPWGNAKRGSNYPEKWDPVFSQLLEGQHLLGFEDQIQGIFNRNVPIRIILNIMTNKIVKKSCYIRSFRHRGIFLWRVCMQWAFKITLDLMVKFLTSESGAPPQSSFNNS